MYIYVHVCIYALIYMYIRVQELSGEWLKHKRNINHRLRLSVQKDMGWLRAVGSIKL